MSYIDVTGKTEEEAIRKGLEQLGMDRDDVSVEILERAKSGFLGIGSSPARVRLTYGPEEAPVAEPAPIVKPVVKKPAEEKPAAPAAKPAAPKAEDRPARPRNDRPDRNDRPARPPRTDRPQQTERPEKKDIPTIDLPLCEDENAQRIVAFVTGLLEHMDSVAQVKVYEVEKGRYKVILEGDKLGQLIGRRGETLDAIQHLTNYAVNRGQNKRVRINVDAESYRLKREQALQRLAQKVAGKVTRYRRNITLEPMNAYERHVIHAALQDHPDVTTFSTGTEPNRRIVVAYSRYKSAEAAVKKDFPETEEE